MQFLSTAAHSGEARAQRTLHQYVDIFGHTVWSIIRSDEMWQNASTLCPIVRQTPRISCRGGPRKPGGRAAAVPRRSNDTTELDDPNSLAAQHIDLIHPIVTQVASRFPRHVDRSELWSAGAIGLVEASRSYNPETGVPFNRYASIRIRGAMIDSARKRDWAVRSLRRQMRELHEAEQHIETTKGRHATDLEIADALKITPEEVEQGAPLRRFLRCFTSTRKTPTASRSANASSRKNPSAFQKNTWQVARWSEPYAQPSRDCRNCSAMWFAAITSMARCCRPSPPASVSPRPGCLRSAPRL